MFLELYPNVSSGHWIQMAQEEKVRLLILHSPPSLKTKSSASHVIISLMSWSSLKMKDERILSSALCIFFVPSFLSSFIVTP